MSHVALISPPMNDPTPTFDERRMYEEVLVRAMAHAERLLSRDQAFEVAHDVAIEMMRRPPELVSGVLIYIAVTSRLRNLRRTTERRAALEGAYVAMSSETQPAWSQPGAELEASELRQRIDAVVAQMPKGMRDVFVLVREQELSYKEAAAQLRVGVGTIHTQLSRANALLRECVERYRAGPPDELRQNKGRNP